MTAIVRYQKPEPRPSLFNWLLQAVSLKPKTACQIDPIAEQDIPEVWRLLRGYDFSGLEGDWEQVALRKLDSLVRKLQQRKAVVRAVYFAMDRLPLGLIKIHNQHDPELSRFLVSLPYAQGCAYDSWIWLATTFVHKMPKALPAPVQRKALPAPRVVELNERLAPTRTVAIPLETPVTAVAPMAPVVPVIGDDVFDHPELDVSDLCADEILSSLLKTSESVVEVPSIQIAPTRNLDFPKPYVVGNGPMKDIYVGIGTVDQEWVYAPLKHGAVINPTGGGKTNLFGLMMAQVRYLMAQGEPLEMFYATCKYVPIDPIDGLDQRPLIDGLDPKNIAIEMDRILNWLARVSAYAMARYNRMRSQPGWFPEKTAVVFLDELKGFFELLGDEKIGNTSYKKMASRYLKILLIMAREANMHVIFASQDCYCGSVTLTRAEMKNLGLVLIHPSSDDRSLENALGKEALTLPKGGLHDWYLFSKARSSIALVSVPRVTQGLLQTYGLNGTNIDVFLSETTLGFVAQVETPQTSELPVEELVTSVAQRLGLSLPLALAEIENKQVKSLIKLAAKRGMKVQPIARLLFDAGSNGRFQSERIKPLITEKT